MSKPLTPRQSAILDAIKEFHTQNHYMPTSRELAARFGCAMNAINTHLAQLELKGVIRRTPKAARSIVLVDEIPTV